VKTSSNLEDGLADSLSQKLSRKLNGKPVFLSWSVSAARPDFVFQLEKAIFDEISKHPEKF
jgi:hypothetical protein